MSATDNPAWLAAIITKFPCPPLVIASICPDANLPITPPKPWTASCDIPTEYIEPNHFWTWYSNDKAFSPVINDIASSKLPLTWAASPSIYSVVSYILFKNAFKAASMPKRPAVVSCCWIRTNLNNVPLAASNVVAILSFNTASVALCSTLNAIPCPTIWLTLFAKSLCLTSGEIPAIPVISLLMLSQYDPAQFLVFLEPYNLVSIALLYLPISSIFESNCLAISLTALVNEAASLPKLRVPSSLWDIL